MPKLFDAMIVSVIAVGGTSTDFRLAAAALACAAAWPEPPEVPEVVVLAPLLLLHAEMATNNARTRPAVSQRGQQPSNVVYPASHSRPRAARR